MMWSEARRGTARGGFGLLLGPLRSWRDLWHMAVPGISFAGDLGVWHIALHHTSVANATLLPNFAPVFVTLFGWLLFRLAVTRTFLTGLSLALAGAVVLMGESFTVSGETLLGDALCLLVALFYAGYLLGVARLRARFSTAAVMAWSTLFTTSPWRSSPSRWGRLRSSRSPRRDGRWPGGWR